MPRYLTKSRFKLALECPAKLFYTRKSEYPDAKSADAFMAALAEGGFQVGELAKCYYPDGHDITTLDYEKAIAETNELLKQENVVIFEAAFRYKDLFIRADIVEKRGNRINLLEVKSKSFNGDDSSFIGTRSGKLTPTWKPYLFDVAFQKYVIQKAHPEWSVSSFLMLADKTKDATVEGLNQKFLLLKDENNRKYCATSGDVSRQALGDEILVRVNVDQYVGMIHNGSEKGSFQDTATFEEWIDILSEAYSDDKQIAIPIHKGCGKCEYKCSAEEEAAGKKSGFKECMLSRTSLKECDLLEPLIFELWKGGLVSNDVLTKLIKNNTFHLKDIEEKAYSSKNRKTTSALSPTERRTLQIEKVRNKDTTPYIDKEGLLEEMSKWTYPLHFIDFETSMVAIPFNKGRRPYEGIAFQFSHHRVDKDGTISHAGQYLNTNRGEFPNFDFVRELKKELSHDNGTIFRYAPHENSYLNMIYKQLIAMPDESVPDKRELIDFIKSITKSSGDVTPPWEGDRCMVDQWELVKKYYYHPEMKGSNSIKDVLPAILNDSEYLKHKYPEPIYGKNKEIKSLNLNEQTWITMKNGKVINPYKQLPNLFVGVSAEELDRFITDSSLADGGAAMTAYAKMQFSDMTDTEKKMVEDGLLRYCELDTMAMVFIYEYWKDVTRDN